MRDGDGEQQTGGGDVVEGDKTVEQGPPADVPEDSDSATDGDSKE